MWVVRLFWGKSKVFLRVWSVGEERDCKSMIRGFDEGEGEVGQWTRGLGGGAVDCTDGG